MEFNEFDGISVQLLFQMSKGINGGAWLNKTNLIGFGVLFFLFLTILLIFITHEEENSSGFENVSAEEARELIEEDNVFVLDVRTPSEFNSSHLKGATLIPFKNASGSNLSPEYLLEARIKEVPMNKKILVYCRTGRRSAAASTILVNAGYSKVYNMVGGINSWIDAGYPVVSKDQNNQTSWY